MASSISHSERRVPRLALRLLAVAGLTWATCAAYSLWLNPETRFIKVVAHTKQNWAQKMTREHGAKFLIFSASSSMFSIDAERLLERHHLPLVNMGLVRAYNAKMITEWALSETKRGDTLIMAFEPGLLTEDVQPTSEAVQFAYAMRSPWWIHGVLEPFAPLGPGSLLGLRPGGYHVCTLLWKIPQRRPMYRYSIAEIHPSGWVETPVRMNLGGAPGHGEKISPGASVLLLSLDNWCRTNGVRLCYSLPLAWCAPNELQYFQRQNAKFLLEISEFLPVLADRRLGAHTNAELFADTAWHLNTTGVALRTDELAAQLRAGRMWKPEELRFISTNGFAALPSN